MTLRCETSRVRRRVCARPPACTDAAAPRAARPMRAGSKGGGRCSSRGGSTLRALTTVLPSLTTPADACSQECAQCAAQ